MTDPDAKKALNERWPWDYYSTGGAQYPDVGRSMFNGTIKTTRRLGKKLNQANERIAKLEAALEAADLVFGWYVGDRAEAFDDEESFRKLRAEVDE